MFVCFNGVLVVFSCWLLVFVVLCACLLVLLFGVVVGYLCVFFVVFFPTDLSSELFSTGCVYFFLQEKCFLYLLVENTFFQYNIWSFLLLIQRILCLLLFLLQVVSII